MLLGQQSDDGECYTIGAVVADHLKMPSLTQVIKMDVDERQAALRAPGRVRLRHGRGRAPGRDLRRRRDQRAALPVAEGDHGREEEAARHEGRRRRRHRGRQGRRATARARRSSRSTRRPRRPPARSSRTRTRTRRSRRSWPGSMKGSCWHERDPHLRTPLRGRVQQELARRGLRGREARQGDRRRRRGRGRRRRRPDRRPLRHARQLRRDEGLPRQRPGGPRRTRSSTRWRRSSPTTTTPTHCSAAGCSDSRSAPASPRASTAA